MYNEKIFLCLTAIFLLGVLQAQERYLNEITDSVTIATCKYIHKAGQNLDMDIYTPAYDEHENRPVFLFVHGGGFSGGNRNDPGIVDFCKKIARRGYVAVSISYRLTRKGTKTGFGCDCLKVKKLAAINAAVEDVQDAVRFLIENKDDFGIDPYTVILTGSSAGAETVLSAVYNPPSCESDSVHFRYAGIISMAGAITDTTRINSNSSIPSLFFHGTCDSLVPYGTAPHHYCDEGTDGYLIMYGSGTIADKLKKMGKPYWLFTVCGEYHRVAWTPMNDYFNQIITFCYDFVFHHSRDQIHTIIQGTHNCDL